MEQSFQYFIDFVLLIELFLCLKRSLYGLCGLVAIRILIPEVVRISSPFALSLNTFCVLFLFLSVLIGERHKKMITSIPKTIIIFFLLLIICLFLSDYSDLHFQISSTIKLFLTDYLPAILAFNIIKSIDDIKLFVKVVAISIIVSCTWAIITSIIGFNPYIVLIRILYSSDGQDDNVELFTDATSSGTFTHTNGFGFFIPIAFSFFMMILNYSKDKINYFVLIALILGSICCQKRTCFIALFLYVLFLILYSNGKFKWSVIRYSILFIFLFVISMGLLQKDSRISRVVTTSIFFWDDNVARENDIGGSSMEMRMDQITYPFVMIEDNLLFGKGSGYIDYYQHVEADLVHPVLKGFETLPCRIEVETGLFGFFLWFYFISRMMKLTYIHDNKSRGQFYGFWLSQIVVWIASGFSSFTVFGIFVVVMPKLRLLNNRL